MTEIKTACPLDCWDACSMIAVVKDNKIVSLRGDETHPVTKGTICSRGRRILDRTYSPDRILTPKKKVKGVWCDITWDDALTEIAEKIQHALDAHGHHSIFHNYDWGSGTILKSLNQRFFYQLGGCTETVGSLCWDAGLMAQTYDFGQARSHHPSDLRHARRIVVWGRNLPVTNMHMVPFVREAMEQGAELMVINPLPTDLDRKASVLIRPRPGTDGALALGALRICRDNDWIDKTFIDHNSIGFAELSAYLDSFTLDFVSAETNVPVHLIQELATWYGKTQPLSTLLGLGLQRYAGGGNTIRAIDALAAATGQIGKKGGGVNYANREMTQFIDEAALTGRENADVREFERGTQALSIINADPPIDLMFVTRTNPVSQVPNTESLLKAYAAIPTIVVLDTMMTATAELADYFLPCTTVFEEEDISLSTMWHPYITFANRVIDPEGEAKADHEIFALLADRLGFGDDMHKPLEEWFERALRPLSRHNLGIKDLRNNGTLQIPLADVPFNDGVFVTPSKKFEFASKFAQRDGLSLTASYVQPKESMAVSNSKGAQYPYALLTIHPRTSENSQHRHWPQLPNRPTAEISEVIAAETGLSTGADARLQTPYGELRVYIKVIEDGHPYTVKLESGWWNGGMTINQLTPVRSADFGSQTAQYDVSCNLVLEA
ncbi:molybdopterin-dependent oxidoreductase [Alicyclobacillus ferrooxydans]|uniref:4Fe-4S Mo/W bis-MGD-type domain-containing protein n=1 Tax=Alicyclobacillus ferrooxydans TaxID=471514 RepID=A0A0P9CAR4_9BACL|nr:molybdopterin-dependent oxidoreductase [Alicyclobacillus ferrooxydans]KPV42497.1 hypothetical protein AN477_17230 [Alicyclobacillus ferrooxydans]